MPDDYGPRDRSPQGCFRDEKRGDSFCRPVPPTRRDRPRPAVVKLRAALTKQPPGEGIPTRLGPWPPHCGPGAN